MSEIPTTIHGLLAAYRRGLLTPIEVVDHHLTHLARVEPKLNAFAVVDRDGARKAAQHSTSRWQRGDRVGDLEGVPITVKDIVAMAGLPTREGSKVTSELKALVDSPVVARLREAGAVILGKTNTPEFGWKGITDSPAFGTTRSPWNPEFSPGGSSGGAAAALAAGVGVAAHGNDGGGSIRIPASYCGLIGLKPTFGRVAQAPVESPYATLVANGPLTRSVEDAALLLNVMSRPDIRDWHAIPHYSGDWRIGLNDGLRGVRIGYTERLGGAAVDPEVRRVCRSAVDRLAIDGYEVTELDEVIEPLRPQFEAYWKAGFAHRLRTIPTPRHNDLDPDFRKLAEEGLDVTVEEIDAAYAARARLVARMRRLHLDFDLLITPTMPTPPPRADVVYHSSVFDRWDHAVPFTVPFNLTGQPAASVPVGLTGLGLPIGLQIAANHFREDLILRAARVVLDLLAWRWPEANLARRIAVLQA
ncbi:MAG: amidase [Acidimicrobiia bacterium]|nr:amidase [Acidimicrobiia bacterium]MDH5290729.1 amidase [Acidimicrobiia bacterium]